VLTIYFKSDKHKIDMTNVSNRDAVVWELTREGLGLELERMAAMKRVFLGDGGF
jgi:hypothetical protein